MTTARPPSADGWLRIEEPGRSPRFVAMGPGGVTIGRDPACDIVVDDPRASRRHAEIEVLDGTRVTVRDLGSTNGTFVGELRIPTAVALSPHETLRIGRTTIAFEPATHVVRSAAPTGGSERISRARSGSPIASVPPWSIATVAAVVLGVAALNLAGFFGGSASGPDQASPLPTGQAGATVAGSTSSPSPRADTPAPIATPAPTAAPSGPATAIQLTIKTAGVSVDSKSTTTEIACSRDAGQPKSLRVKYRSSSSSIDAFIADTGATPAAATGFSVNLKVTGLEPLTLGQRHLESIDASDAGDHAAVRFSASKDGKNSVQGSITCNRIAA